jgi:hypothetical protein
MNVGAALVRNPDSPDGIAINALQPLAPVRWVPCLTVVTRELEAWNAVTKVVSTGLATGVILEEPSGSLGDICSNSGSGTVTIKQETSQVLAVETRTDQPGALIMANTWYPGWEARVDGISVPLLRANYLFMGIPLGPGEHQIVIQYRPISFLIGAGISLFGLLFMISWSMLRRHRVQ